MPDSAVIFGDWKTIVPLQYLQIIEGQRNDLKLRNLFLFEDAALKTYLASDATELNHSVVFLEPVILKYLNQRFSQARPLQVALPEQALTWAGSEQVGFVLTERPGAETAAEMCK